MSVTNVFVCPEQALRCKLPASEAQNNLHKINLDPHAAFGGTIRKMKKCQGDPVDFRSERSTE